MHLVLVTAFPPSLGSLNEYGAHLARVMAAKPEVTRLTVLADELPDPALSRHDPQHVRRVWRFNDPGNALRIAAALRDLKPDAVLYNLQFASFGDRKVPAALGLLAPLVTRLGGTPTVTLLHNIFETVDLEKAGFGSNVAVNLVTRAAGRVFTRVLMGSHLLALTMPRYVETLRDAYGARNVFLAPHGSFQEPEPAAPLPERRTVMTFGKFGTYKRVEVLLDAHRLLLQRDPDVRLVIAGSDSPNAKGYLAAVQERHRDVPNVTFTGYVAEEDVPRVFRECSVVAFPYNSTTGSSGVLHQAGEYARAAVMPRIGDLADLIEEEGYRAEFFEPEDAASLAEALWRVIETPGRARDLGLANLNAARGLSLSDVADWYLLQFQRLSAPRGVALGGSA
ncbi:glycosyltransferase [Deinococcus aquiradiocola]|uniref:Glycosyl transferase family 1 n=1 Tax=Deinococcus aquiradiocola TaxID=393059 RepID=A0A917PBV8_9DEIO|nr:glycosyltransferase [Deinococcus aquiradiocola]GGJ70257.1 glycosyl transferase family 1 [Deinococcus aquiradiocola]